MTNKRKILIASTACVLIVFSLILFLMTKATDSTKKNETTAAPFSINGLDSVTYPLEASTKQSITEQIDFYLRKADINTTNLKGAVRKGSYIEKEYDNGTLVEFLVDIRDAKRTYKVSSANSHDSEGDFSLYIVCPSEAELIYAPFECESDIQEEGASI